MRITPHEREQIVAAARRHFGVGSRVVLFGSRLDDQARGGDIDLLIETHEPITQPVRKEAEFLMDLWGHIGEQRIDLVVRAPGLPTQKIHEIAEALGEEL